MATTFEDAYERYKTGSQGQAVASMYDANRDAQLASMEAEYNRARSQQQADAGQIAENYRRQFNAIGADYERQRRNNNMQAAASGLNTGTASQMQLAQSGAYQRAAGQLGAAQAQEETAAARGLSDLEAAYRAQVNQAVASADYEKAAALLKGYDSDRTRQLQEAATLAGYGNFDAYANIYGADTAEQMRQLWIAQNPLLAYNTGAITAAEYQRITGKYAPGTAPVASYGGGGSGSSKKSTTGGSGADVTDLITNTIKKSDAGSGAGGNPNWTPSFPGIDDYLARKGLAVR